MSGARIRHRLDAVQTMRAIAALAVVAFHSGREATDGAAADTLLLRLLDICDIGVDIFFVISGFIMYYVTHGRPDGPRAARDFLLKRMIRVAPIYWLFTALFLIPVLLAPALLNRSGVSLPYILASYLFVPWQRPLEAVPSISPLFGLGWTLNYEVGFYLLFALLIAIGTQRKLLWLAIVFGALALAGPFVPATWAQAFFWTRSIILEFVGGVAIAALFCRGTRIGVAASGILIAAAVAIWIAGGLLTDIHATQLNIRGPVWGAAACLLMAAILLCPNIEALVAGRPNGPMARLGDASFSLYLSHLFVIRIVTLLSDRMGVSLAPWLLTIVNMALASLVALAVYRLLERPILHRLTALFFPARQPPAILAEDRPRQPRP